MSFPRRRESLKFPGMKKKVQDEKQLVAEFFSNIGVAWFASGVIGIFLGEIKAPNKILASLTWGITFSFIFLLIGVQFVKRKI